MPTNEYWESNSIQQKLSLKEIEWTWSNNVAQNNHYCITKVNITLSNDNKVTQSALEGGNNNWGPHNHTISQDKKIAKVGFTIRPDYGNAIT